MGRKGSLGAERNCNVTVQLILAEQVKEIIFKLNVSTYTFTLKMITSNQKSENSVYPIDPSLVRSVQLFQCSITGWVWVRPKEKAPQRLTDRLAAFPPPIHRLPSLPPRPD
jgi:hypothetical protein